MEITRKEARESNHSCTQHTVLTRYIIMYLPNIFKITVSQRVLKLVSEQVFLFKIPSRTITPKMMQKRATIIYVTYPLDLIYMPTKYYQNISKGI